VTPCAGDVTDVFEIVEGAGEGNREGAVFGERRLGPAFDVRDPYRRGAERSDSDPTAAMRRRREQSLERLGCGCLGSREYAAYSCHVVTGIGSSGGIGAYRLQAGGAGL
jgi:hypothetical protein